MALFMPAVDGNPPVEAGTLPSIPDRLIAPAVPPGGTAWGLGPSHELAPGRRVLKLLGGGERYEAYVVWEDRLLAPVVAKVLRPHLVGDPRARQAMAGEVGALNALSHPGLVRGFGAQLDAPAPHLLLELLDGPRLSTLLQRYGPLSAEQIVLLARQMASVLHYVGGQGWVHLDVKPRNIVMTASPRLIDLSVARPLLVRRRASGVGTAAYMAPEQIDPSRAREIGPPSDMFGMAATLYEALTGAPAFAARPGMRYPQLMADRPAFPAKTPPLLAGLLRSALAGEPERRPSAATFHDALDDLVQWAWRSARRFR